MLDLRCCDNMEMMAKFEDKHFDLAIVDPEYGIGFSDYERVGMGAKVQKRFTKNGKKKWDEKPPDEAYFKELFRVSKNQIIWGGNYFNMPPCKCFIFWYKQNPVPNFSDGEFAWTSFDKPAVCFPFRYYGSLQGNTSADKKIHPTQKPIQLYDFCLGKFATPGMKILDTHLGSGSIAISCHYNGFDLTASEIDEDIYNEAMIRIKQETIQERIFAPEPQVINLVQTNIFDEEQEN